MNHKLRRGVCPNWASEFDGDANAAKNILVNYIQGLPSVGQDIYIQSIMTITEDEVLAKEALLPKNLKPFQGTLNIHQVLRKQDLFNLLFRKASCFNCQSINHIIFISHHHVQE